MSLPLRNSVFTWPWTTSTLIGPSTEMASPSMTPIASAGGLSARAGAPTEQAARTAAQARNRAMPLDVPLLAVLVNCCALHRGRGKGRHSIYYRKMENRDIQGQDSEAAVGAHYDTRLPQLPWSRRIQIPIIAALVYSVIRTLGPTLRFEPLGEQQPERVYASGQRCIFAFWHRIIIPVAWWARNRGIVVLNTTA